MHKIALGVWVILLSGCTLGNLPGIYKLDIVQGNVVTQEKVNQLRLGMSQTGVRALLGTPQLTDTFHPERWDYIQRFQAGGKDAEQKRLTLIFDERTRLVRIEGDFQPDLEAAPPSNPYASLAVPPQPDKEEGLLDRLASRVWPTRD